MPHLIIEHSSDIKKYLIKNLQKEIQSIMQSHEGSFLAEECKCRSFSFDEYLVGLSDEKNSSFVHITLKALSGRSAEIRKSLAKNILAFAESFIKDLNLDTERCDISVDFVEMERESYQKVRIKGK